MSAASNISAYQKSPPGLCCSIFWSPSDNLDLNVSATLFPPFLVDVVSNLVSFTLDPSSFSFIMRHWAHLMT